MKTYFIDDYSNIDIKEDIVACIGYFDGLHKGHQALIEKMKDEANRRKTKSCLITFYPDPKDVITNNKHLHIQSFKDRLLIAEKMDIDICIIFNFTTQLCHMDEKTFFDTVLKALPLKALVCGFDFHYAYMGKGDANSLKENALGQFDVYIIDEVSYLNEKISSTRIRYAIESGDIELANELLGYSYFNSGEVIHGKGNGHKLGFPTANLKFDNEIISPKNGVYIGFAKIRDRFYKAMINIGDNPTISDDNKVTYEINIVDFNEDIYGETIVVYLLKRIRDEKKFASIDDLIAQLTIDQKKASNQDERELVL